MKYYRLLDDIYYPQRWYLGEIIGTDDNWQFTSGKKINEVIHNLRVAVYKDGEPMDFTTNEAYSIPIVSQKVKNQFSGLKDLQFIPIHIDKKKVDTDFFIMVVTNIQNCVNEELSEFGKFIENDPIRPDKSGHYSWFTRLVINPTNILGIDIFRIEKAENYLVVSEKLKSGLEKVNVTGISFIEV